MVKWIGSDCIILLVVTLLVSFPSLLASPLWKKINHRPITKEQWHKRIANQIDDCCTSKPKYKQIVYLDNNKAMSNRRESSVVLIRQENAYPQSEQVDQVNETLEVSYDYSSEANDDPGTNCNEQQENNEEGEYEKKIWKASLILGSIGMAFCKWGLVTISPLFVVQPTTTTTTSTTTTPTTTTSTTTLTTTTTPTTTTSTTSTTTTPTTTTSTKTTTSTTTSTTTTTPTTTTTLTTTTTPTTTVEPVTCTTTTTVTTGDYKTIRNPDAQVAQCLAITVAVGSNIQITCTAVYTQAGTYTRFYTNSGTTLITGSAVVGTTYTSTDNTLTIESLTGSSNSSTLCCTWKTV